MGVASVSVYKAVPAPKNCIVVNGRVCCVGVLVCLIVSPALYHEPNLVDTQPKIEPRCSVSLIIDCDHLFENCLNHVTAQCTRPCTLTCTKKQKNCGDKRIALIVYAFANPTDKP